MRLNRQLLASLLLAALLLTGLLPGAAAESEVSEAGELSASYEPASYNNIAVTNYSRALLFQDGVVAAMDDQERYGLIDSTGAVRVPFQYDYLEATGGGYFVVEQDGRMGIMDCDGQLVLPIVFSRITTKNNTLYCWGWSEDGTFQACYYTEDMQPAAESDYDGENDYINVEGYSSVRVLSGGYYLAYGDSGTAVLDSNFQPILPAGRYGSVSVLGYVGETPYFECWDLNYQQKCITNPYGREILPMGDYPYIDSINPSGKVAVTGYIQGNWLSAVYDLSTGKEVGRWADREVRTSASLRDLVFTIDGEKYGTMDEMGNIRIPNQFDTVIANDDLDYVVVGNWNRESFWTYLLGLYTADGKEVLPVQFRQLTYLWEDDYLVSDGTHSGIVDNTGAFSLPMVYQKLYPKSPDYLIAINDSGRMMVLDSTGREVFRFPESLEDICVFCDPSSFGVEYYRYNTLSAQEDGYTGSVLPFRVKTQTGYETHYVDWKTGQDLGWLPVVASNINSDGRFVYRDEATGLYGFGRLTQGAFPQNPDAPDSGLPEEVPSEPDYLLESAHDLYGLDTSLTYTYTYAGTRALDVTFSPHTDVPLTLNGQTYSADELAGQTVRIQGDTLRVELASLPASDTPLFGFAVERVWPVGSLAEGLQMAAVYTAESGSGAEAVLSGLRSGEPVQVTLVGQGSQTRCLLGAIYGADGVPLDFAVVPVAFEDGVYTAGLDFARYGQAVTLKLFLMDENWAPEMVNLTLTDAG